MTTFDYIGGIASLCLLLMFIGYGLYSIISYIVEDTAKKIFKVIEGKQE